jgi:hypothetical protein
VPADHKISPHVGNNIKQPRVKFGGFPVIEIVQELLSDTCQQRAVVSGEIARALRRDRPGRAGGMNSARFSRIRTMPKHAPA